MYFFLQCNSTLGSKIGKLRFPSQFANIFLTYQTFITNLFRVKIRLLLLQWYRIHSITPASHRRFLWQVRTILKKDARTVCFIHLRNIFVELREINKLFFPLYAVPMHFHLVLNELQILF